MGVDSNLEMGPDMMVNRLKDRQTERKDTEKREKQENQDSTESNKRKSSRNCLAIVRLTEESGEEENHGVPWT